VTIVRSKDTRSHSRAESGSAIAEIALILPLLVLVLVGLIEVGRFGNYTILVGNAARAGVQYGAQNTVTAADIAGMRSSALRDGQNLTGLSATPTIFCQCADGSTSTCLETDCSASHRIIYVQVITSATVPSITNSSLLPSPLRTITVQGRAVMRVAQ
jgi:Flp pilus assembly protein TadG